MRDPPIVREIVSDINTSLAKEFARRGVSSVLALDVHQNCLDRIKRLSLSGIRTSCISNTKDVRNWQQLYGHRRGTAEGVGVIIYQANYKYVPLLASLSHTSRIRALAVFGQAKGPGVHVALSSPAATFDKVLFQSEASFRQAFSEVYRKQIWGSGGGGSGHGSDVAYTQNLRMGLIGLLNRYNIKSMLDSSCGSMAWMPLVLDNITLSQPDFRFMGTDVVDFLIQNHTRRFANHTNWSFKSVDYAHEPLPSGYELVFSRDSLQHLPLDSTWMLLNNVRNSGAKYLLVGSYVTITHGSNNNIKVSVC